GDLDRAGLLCRIEQHGDRERGLEQSVAVLTGQSYGEQPAKTTQAAERPEVPTKLAGRHSASVRPLPGGLALTSPSVPDQARVHVFESGPVWDEQIRRNRRGCTAPYGRRVVCTAGSGREPRGIGCRVVRKLASASRVPGFWRHRVWRGGHRGESALHIRRTGR